MSLSEERATVERYAREAARLARLEIADPWWPAVIEHLSVLLERAASLEGAEVEADPGPVFQP